MVRAYLGLGGNLGYRLSNLRSAAHRIRRRFPVTAASSVYETEPVGYRNQPAFLNAVLAVDAPVDPFEFHQALREIELDLGRRRTFPNAPRTIDIDILLFDDRVISEDELTIPHPRMHERAFVIVPLAEIAPDMMHPVSGRSMSEIQRDLRDTAEGIALFSGPEWIDSADHHGDE